MTDKRLDFDQSTPLRKSYFIAPSDKSPRPHLRYDREMIANCIDEVEHQDLDRRHWFEAHNVAPFQVTYDDLTGDTAGVFRGIRVHDHARDHRRTYVLDRML
jgi:LPS sulfotransferase NodH